MLYDFSRDFFTPPPPIFESLFSIINWRIWTSIWAKFLIFVPVILKKTWQDLIIWIIFQKKRFHNVYIFNVKTGKVFLTKMNWERQIGVESQYLISGTLRGQTLPKIISELGEASSNLIGQKYCHVTNFEPIKRKNGEIPPKFERYLIDMTLIGYKLSHVTTFRQTKSKYWLDFWTAEFLLSRLLEDRVYKRVNYIFIVIV